MKVQSPKIVGEIVGKIVKKRDQSLKRNVAQDFLKGLCLRYLTLSLAPISYASVGILPSLPSTSVASELSPVDRLRQIGYGHLVARALHVASYYKFFDCLQDGAKSAEEMAKGGYQHPHSIKRIMRVLANHGLVNIDENDRYSLNGLSQFLVSTAEPTFQPALAKEFDLHRWQAIGNIHLTCDEGSSSFEQLFGQAFYAYLEEDQKANELFNKGMKNFSEYEDKQVALSYDFKKFATYCDIGGGTGGLLSQVLSLNPQLKAYLFDLPEAVKQCDVANVIKIGGNFFDAVPKAELYTLKRVLHNWGDDDCVKILKNVRQAMSHRENGEILVIEKILPSELDGSFLIDSDIIAMALGGRERTLSEFIKIAEQAQLSFVEQRTLKSGVSILVLKPFK